jgi:hypothetical protein
VGVRASRACGLGRGRARERWAMRGSEGSGAAGGGRAGWGEGMGALPWPGDLTPPARAAAARFSCLAWRMHSLLDAMARWGGRERTLSPAALSGALAARREGHQRAKLPSQGEMGEFDVNHFR